MSDSAETSAALHDCDVLVIGGGPAGSTVAPLLVEKGYRVVLLEKCRHPRFHIGESLLPANLPLLERLGVADQVKAVGMQKWGAEFVSPWHDHAQVFEFAEAWDKSMPYAYQVRRSEFDEILIRNAEKRGAEVHEECKVTGVEFLEDDAGAVVTAQSADGLQHQWRTRFVIDASGRDTVLANQFQIKRRNTRHNSAAVYAHYRGAKRHEGPAEGNITVFWFEHGWFWFIPLMDGVTSVGMVTWPYYFKTRSGRKLEQFLQDSIAMCPALAERLRDSELASEPEATANFSYVADRTHGNNYLLLGDAFAFIDPVFSSGVWLAMNSGATAAETVDRIFRKPNEKAEALARFDQSMRRGPKEFSWFIYRVTNPTMRELFMGPRNILRVKEALLSVLAGDIFGKTPIWRSLAVFKAIYYCASLVNFRRSWRAWNRRRFNIQPTEES
jgi:flavin-dependent dehydrogenase